MEGVCAKWFSRKKIKSCRKPSKRFLELKQKLGLDPNLATCDEQDIISALQVASEGEIILTEYCIENKRLDAYFYKYTLGIEVDEYKIIMKTEILIMKKVDN